MRTRSRLLVLSMALLLGAAACGDADGTVATDDPDADATALDGREFWSTEVIEDGDVRELVPGTRISLSFEGNSIGASAGCNGMGGSYSIDGGVLTVGEMSSTAIGCDDGRHDQDSFVADFLQGSPTVSLDGNNLRLVAGDSEMALLDTVVANPDRPIIGTKWQVDGFLQSSGATAFNVEQQGSIVFNEDSTMSVFDGCREFVVPVEVSDGSTGGPVEGDGELQFGQVQSIDPDCPNQEYLAAFHALFETGAATFTIDGAGLTILNENDIGTTLIAQE